MNLIASLRREAENETKETKTKTPNPTTKTLSPPPLHTRPANKEKRTSSQDSGTRNSVPFRIQYPAVNER